jgi:hypothetical protein
MLFSPGHSNVHSSLKSEVPTWHTPSYLDHYVCNMYLLCVCLKLATGSAARPPACESLQERKKKALSFVTDSVPWMIQSALLIVRVNYTIRAHHSSLNYSPTIC